MSNLFYALEEARHDFILMSDSDTRVDPYTLQRIAALREQGAELITCLARYRYADNLWGRIYAAFWNFEQMGFIAPAIRRHGRKAIGNTIAMSRSTLEQLGGLEAFRDYVAEDVAMGIKANELGMRVALGPVIDSPGGCNEPGLAAQQILACGPVWNHHERRQRESEICGALRLSTRPIHEHSSIQPFASGTWTAPGRASTTPGQPGLANYNRGTATVLGSLFDGRSFSVCLREIFLFKNDHMGGNQVPCSAGRPNDSAG